jgi:ABC-type transporter Mla subunit MlaD
VSDGLQAIRDDLSKISAARGDLSDERRKEVDSANDAFANTVRDTLADVGTTASLSDASARITDALAQLATSYKNSFGKIDCS